MKKRKNCIYKEYTIEEIEYKGNYYQVDIELEIETQNDGIGSYEFWGAPGYDYGKNYNVISNYEIIGMVDENDQSFEFNPTDKELNKTVGEYLEKNEPDIIDKFDFEVEE